MDDKREKLLPSSSPSKLLSVDEELWQMAEERAQEILWTIEPKVLSEVNRKNVIDYVQRLIGDYCGAQVLPFGSFPLKTYLPDGDIDLTALSHEGKEKDLVQAVRSLLESQDDPEYQVEDIQYIDAQVQLVKCTVKNIPVDISFNQMGGFYTLCFLEQVDHLVGKNHIFKRSIILIKAWCFYESRVLGAHYGLLSTYATEILALYIINRFHSSVRGPLEVLYIFLDYYSSFDWELNYISIWGPKALSSLPEIVDTPECDQNEFLLQKEFLRNYRDMCSSKPKASETMTHEFPTKFMNILDPLRNDNNLGRSVNLANLHRIRLALSYGARRLKQILTLAGENLGAALEKFFSSTLDRNGKGERADVDVPVSPFGTGRSEESVFDGDCDSYYHGSLYAQLYPNDAMPVTTVQPKSPSSPSQDNILALSTQQNWSEGDFLALSTQQYWNEGDLLALSTQQNWSESDLLALSTQQNWSEGDLLALSTQQNWSEGDLLALSTQQNWSEGDLLALSTQQNWSEGDLLALSTQQNWSEGDLFALPTQQNWSGGDLLALPTQQNWSEGDLFALSTQQDWSMFYQSGADAYISGQTPFHPTYSFEEGGRSRGTGTYIPDLNYNCYWDIRATANRLRRFPSAKNNALEKSSPQMQQVEEVHSETDVKDNSRPFELSIEDFPLLPGIRKATPPTQAQESAPLVKVHSETDMDGNSRLSELSKEDFSHLPCVHKATQPKQAQESAPFAKLLSDTGMDGNSRSFELSKEDFPLLPKVYSETHMDGNSKSFELSKKDFPLQRTYKTVSSKSALLTKQAKSSLFSEVSKMKNIDFATHKYSQSLTEPSLSTEGEKKDSSVSSS